MYGNCFGNCDQGVGPPPDSILSMPPPPVPSFLLPKSIFVEASMSLNDTQPCFTTLICNPSPFARESSDNFIEFANGSRFGLENAWFFVLITSCIGVLLFGGLFAFILIKCKDTFVSSCNIAYDSDVKQNSVIVLKEPTKTNPPTSNGILYPCASSLNEHVINNQLTMDNRLLWATITPHGTKHFISGFDTNYDAQCEVSQHQKKSNNQIFRGYQKRALSKSFENSIFSDFDYEDPTPLMDSYYDDIDSGYQEPQEVITTLQNSSQRPLNKSPTITDPNRLNLNFLSPNVQSVIIRNQKCSLSNRVSDVPFYRVANM